jgi:hypothetical protein
MRRSEVTSATSRRAALAAIGLLFPILLAAQNYVFGPNVRVNDDSAGWFNHMMVAPGQHLIAARGDTVYLVWQDYRDGVHVYFARSNDGGTTFLPNVRVDRSNQGGNPSLTIDDSGVIHVSWMNGNPGGGGFAHYAKSVDGGLSFLPPVRACDSLYRTQPGAPSIAVTRTGRNVYVARYERWDGDGAYAIWLARSTDGGNTFLAPNTLIRLDSTHDLWDPSVATFGDSVVLVAWMRIDTSVAPLDADVYFARSTDAGSTFGPALLLNDTSGGNRDQQGVPSVVVDETGSVFVGYVGVLPCGLGFAASSDTGRTFGHERSLPLPFQNGTLSVSLFVALGSRLFVSWYYRDDLTTHNKVGFSFSTDGGATFAPRSHPSDAPDSTDEVESTVTANADGRVFIAWCDNRVHPLGFNTDVYFAAGEQSAIGETHAPVVRDTLLAVTPDPAASSVGVEFCLPAAVAVHLEVYDLLGRRRQVLFDGTVAAGSHKQVWNGLDRGGRRAEPGIYIIQLRTPTRSISRKVVML